MQKNTASQKWRVFAFTRSTSVPKTGDAANITATISIDGATLTATNDVNPTELADGFYEFTLTQAETNGDDLLLSPSSVTADIQVIGVPARIATTPVSWGDDVIQTGDSFSRIGVAGVGLTNLGDTRIANLDATVSSRLAPAGTLAAVTLVNGLANDVVDSDALATSAVTEIAGGAADQVWDEAVSDHNTSGSFGESLRQVNQGIVSAESTVNDASATTLSFVTNLTEASDDHYNDLTVVFTTGALTGQSRICTDYNGTTKTLTFDEAWTEAPADTDDFIILNIHNHTLTQISENVRTEIDSNSTQLAAIVADTNELQTDWADGGRLDLILDARASQTSVDTIDGIVDSILVDTGTTLPATLTTIEGKIDTVDGVVDTILVDTNELQTDWVDGGRLDLILDARSSQTSVDTIDTNVDAILVDTGTTIPATLTTIEGKIDTIDTNVDAILVDTGTTIPATLTTIEGKIDTVDTVVDVILVDTDTTIPGLISGLNDPDSATIADAVWDEILTGATHNISTSAGRRLREIASSVIWTGTAQGSGTGTNQIQLDTGASATDNAYDPAIISIIGGTGSGQTRLILQYNGTTKVATVDRDWKVNPSTDSEFVISGDAGREHVNEGLAQGGTANTITLNALASSVDDTYIGQSVFIRSGTGADQSGFVIDYNGTTKVATIEHGGNGGNWGTTPDTTSAYVMLPEHLHTTTEIAESVRTEMDSNSTQLAAILTDTGTTLPATLTTIDGKIDTVDTNVDSVLVDTGTTIPAQISALNNFDPTTDTVARVTLVDTTTVNTDMISATDILTSGDIDGYTLEETLKICLAALAGKVSGGATTTITFRAADDSVDRIVATVDSDGNRSAVTLTEGG